MLVPQSHAREKLAALFWGDSTDEQARLSLRVALNNLRKQLAPDTILADRETVELNPAALLWCDAVELRRLLRAPHSETNLDRALTLYRGELLADFYDDWVLPLRQSLHDSLVSVLLHHVEILRGTYLDAIRAAQQILALEPAHAQAHQRLIFCYGAVGNRTAAAEQYRVCVRALYHELDDITRESISLNDLGEVARTSGQFEQAAAYYRASLDLIRQTGDRRAYVIILSNLGIAASLRHDYAEALRILRETAPLYLEIGEKQNLVYVLSEIAVIWMAQGQAAQAVRLWGATETLRQQLNYRLFADDQTLYETRMAELRALVSPDLFAQEWETGSRLKLADAVALAVAS